MEIDYGEFEKEIEVSGEKLKEFLEELIKKVDSGKIVCKFDEREIYVKFKEPVKILVKYKGSSAKENLEIKINVEGELLPDVPPFQ